MLPSEEEFLAWLDHPATKALYQVLQARKADLQRRWAEGEFADQSQFGTAILNAKAIGMVQAGDEILNMDYEKLMTEIAYE